MHVSDEDEYDIRDSRSRAALSHHLSDGVPVHFGDVEGVDDRQQELLLRGVVPGLRHGVESIGLVCVVGCGDLLERSWSLALKVEMDVEGRKEKKIRGEEKGLKSASNRGEDPKAATVGLVSM